MKHQQKYENDHDDDDYHCYEHQRIVTLKTYLYFVSLIVISMVCNLFGPLSLTRVSLSINKNIINKNEDTNIVTFYRQHKLLSSSNSMSSPSSLSLSDTTTSTTNATTTENKRTRNNSTTDIRCIDIASLSTCDNGEFINFHCQRTYLIRNIERKFYSSISKNDGNTSFTSLLTNKNDDDIMKKKLCSILVANQYERSMTRASRNATYVQTIFHAPVCVQDYNSNACILVSFTRSRDDTKNDTTGSNERQQQERDKDGFVRSVQRTESDVIENYLKQSMSDEEALTRHIALKRIVFPLYYFRVNDITNTIWERYRDNNFGNLVWRYGASRMLNPLTTEIIHDDWNISNVIKTAKEDDGYNTSKKIDALVIACANTFDVSNRPLYRALTIKKSKYIRRLNVPTILLGIGIQVHFPSTDETTATNFSTTTANTTATDAVLNKRQDELTKTKIKLPRKFQKNFLKAVSNHQSKPAIGVRGDMTQAICTNSGITNCISTGCPSLTISRDINLGRTLQTKWIKALQKLSSLTSTTTTTTIRTKSDSENTLKSAKKLRIALTSPSAGKFTELRIALLFIATILDSNTKNHNEIEISIIIQDKNDGIRINNYIEQEYNQINPFSTISTATIVYNSFLNVESWIEFAKNHDLCIAFRIHGAMTFISSGVPAILMPTDYRVMELVMSMHLPFISPDTVLRIQQQQQQQQSNNDNIVVAKATQRIDNDKESVDRILPSTSLSTNNYILLQNLMNQAQQTNFTKFEINRRSKIRLWKTILDVANLEMDPSLLRIIHAPL